MRYNLYVFRDAKSVTERSMSMFTRVSIIAFSGLLLCGCSFFPAQGPSASDVVQQSVSGDPEGLPRYLVTDISPAAVAILKRVPNLTLAGRFGQHPGAPSPTIGVGDTVSVTLWEAASGGLFSSAAVSGVTAGSHSAAIPDQPVGRDGQITIPYAGRVRVAGLTPSQVEKSIVGKLQGKAIEPQALVTVSKNVANSVTVTGEVTTGAQVPLSARGERILDVIALAGGIKAPVHDVFISLSRGATTAKIPMQALLANPRENIFVRSRDVITVESQPQTFTAFGSTGQNQLVKFEAAGITLEEAVAKAGGLQADMANPEGVFLLRAEVPSVAAQLDPAYPIPPGARTVNVVYRINLQDTATYFLARGFQMRNKDVIYVAASPSTEFYQAMRLFSTISQPAMTYGGMALTIKK